MTNQPVRNREQSAALHRQATAYFPGGVSHTVRYEPPHPLYVDRASGAFIWDADGNKYVDFWNNHNASLLGHSHPAVVEAVQKQTENGLHYGTPSEPMIELGQRIQETIPSAERLRFCASGTEAVMYCVRLARAATGRNHVLKIEGAWHGGSTDLSVGVNPPFDERTTAGLPPGIEEYVHTFPLNDVDAVAATLDAYESDVAAVIIDTRWTGFFPDEEFLAFLDTMRERHGYLLIFDEVLTGYRLTEGSYQARVGITPDLTALGKVLGGGLPIGALAGRAELFEAARPDIEVEPGKRVIAGGGTFSANPMTLTAALTTLDVIEREPVLEHTELLARRLRDGLTALFSDEQIDAAVLGIGSLFELAFNPETPLTSPAVLKSSTDGTALREYHNRLIDHGFYVLPGHIGNISYQMTDEHVDGVLTASRSIVREMVAEGLL